MSLSLLIQQYLACLARLTGMVCVMGDDYVWTRISASDHYSINMLYLGKYSECSSVVFL